MSKQECLEQFYLAELPTVLDCIRRRKAAEQEDRVLAARLPHLAPTEQSKYLAWLRAEQVRTIAPLPSPMEGLDPATRQRIMDLRKRTRNG